MAAQEDNVPIPQPPTKFLLGNIPDIDRTQIPSSIISDQSYLTQE